MSRVSIIVFLLFTLMCCKQTANKNPNHSQDNWYDETIKNYVNKSQNPLIVVNRQDGKNIEWLLDRTEDTDSAKYFVFQLGHDEVDKGETNKRFVTDGWIYIDSTSRKLYEYDLENDSIIEWK